MLIKGFLKWAGKTKDLVKEISPHTVALINHRDLDELAAQSLLQKRVKAVLNLEESMSGRYPNKGPSILLNHGIPLFDKVEINLHEVQKDLPVEIRDGSIYQKERLLGKGQLMTPSLLFQKEKMAYENLEEELDLFVENTLTYAQKEKSLILNLAIPETKVKLSRKHALVVVRGPTYKEDLYAISSYIKDIRPVIIGVDGGADGSLEMGFRPDIIIGDMDSVSDRALKSGAELIVHAYPGGCAPGLKRIEDLNLNATLFPAPGTSEDIALLLAYEKGAELIVVVGGHFSFIDFLEKGRPGMGSTFLTRLKIGPVLVDARGVNRLYQSPSRLKDLILFMGAGFLPLVIILFLSPPFNQLLRLFLLQIRILFGL